MNITKIVAVVAIFLCSNFASAEGMFSYVRGQLMNSGMVNTCTELEGDTKCVTVHAYEERALQVETGPMNVRMDGGITTNVHVIVQLYNKEANVWTYQFGNATPDQYSAVDGEVRVRGAVLVEDSDGIVESSTAVLDMTITLNREGYYGIDTSNSLVFGPDNYKSDYKSNEVWSDAMTMGYFSFLGVDIRFDDIPARISINFNRTKQDASFPISGGKG